MHFCKDIKSYFSVCIEVVGMKTVLNRLFIVFFFFFNLFTVSNELLKVNIILHCSLWADKAKEEDSQVHFKRGQRYCMLGIYSAFYSVSLFFLCFCV
jgi:hypothetical protein